MLPLAYLLLVNLAAFVAFAADKRAAERRARRTPERVLLGLAAIGGSPGAYAAQQMFRHKTVKRPFQAAFWTIVALQAAAVGAWLALAR